jgi:DNA-binding transcriptional MocR family regulator
MHVTTRFAQRMERVKPSAIRELLALGAAPDVISFGGGYPDAALFPYEELVAIATAAIVENGAVNLQYSVSNGPHELRALVAGRMRGQGTPTDADEVLILHGGQQGLDLIAKLFLDKGDVVITENPTFLGGLLAFNPYEPQYAVVPIDNDGMDMDVLESTLLQHPGAKFIYTIPDFHNPMGVTMSLPRRKRLIELANRFDVMIIEDTPYREIRFEGESLPTLRSLDSEGRVLYLGSFSKILAPGLRLGWAVAAKPLIDKLTLLKLAADTQCSTLNMAIVTLFMRDYDLDGHIAGLRTAYRRKRDFMVQTIRETFPADVTYTIPQGGLFTWVSFKPGFDTAQFMRDVVLPQARVAYVPGATFFPLNEEHHHARVNFSAQSESKLVSGMTAWGELLKQRY